MITQTRLKELLRYDPETGEFFWKVNVARNVHAGMRAGRLDGYWKIRIDGKGHLGHRLAWLYVYGHFPSSQLDHKNHNIESCRIADLREATPAQNGGNKTAYGRSGYKGARWRKNRWEAQMTKNYKTIYLGRFRTPEAAHAAYCKAAKNLHGEFFYSGRGDST